jgi:hypothetical protein
MNHDANLHPRRFAFLLIQAGRYTLAAMQSGAAQLPPQPADPQQSTSRPGRRRWRRVSLSIVAGYVVLATVLAFGGCVDRMVLFPRAFDANVEGAERKMIAYDGGQVEVWAGRIEGVDQPRAYILTFHGNGDSADNDLGVSSRFWQGQPVEIWSVNFPGYGRSTGPATLERLGPAGLAAFDVLRRHAPDKPILVSGNSLGTTIALHIAARREVAGVMLRDPPALRQVILGEHGWWNLWLFAGPLAMGVPDAVDSLDNAGRSNAPAVFIFNEADVVVPLKYQRQVHDAYAGPKRALLLPGNHNELPAGAESAIQAECGRLLDSALGGEESGRPRRGTNGHE